MDMSVVTSPDIGNMFRGFSAFLFVILLGQILYVVFYYLRVIRLEQTMGVPRVGLLLMHVTILGGVLLGYAGMLTIISYRAIDRPVTWITICITVLNAFTVWGIRIVMAFERKRYEGVLELRKPTV